MEPARAHASISQGFGNDSAPISAESGVAPHPFAGRENHLSSPGHTRARAYKLLPFRANQAIS